MGIKRDTRAGNYIGYTGYCAGRGVVACLDYITRDIDITIPR